MAREHRTRRLELRTRFTFDGDTWTVIGLNGTSVWASRSGGRQRAVLSVADLMDAPDFRVVDDAPADPTGGDAHERVDGAMVGNLTKGKPSKDVNRKLRIVNLLRTGFPNGLPDKVGQAPDPDLGPQNGKTVDVRVDAAARRLGVQKATVYRLLRMEARYRGCRVGGSAPVGDRRSARECPDWMRPLLTIVVVEHIAMSDKSVSELIRQVRNRASGLPTPEAPMPSDQSIRRYLKVVMKAYGFNLDAKDRRSIANIPAGVTRPLVATRPGEYVEIDATPIDVLAIDPDNPNVLVSMTLLLAIDVFSRMIVTARVVAGDPKHEDATGLLHDMLTTRRRKGRRARGLVPENLIVATHATPDNDDGEPGGERDGEPADLVPGAEPDQTDDTPDTGIDAGDTDDAGEPIEYVFGAPLNVTLDHGSVFLCEGFVRACWELGISISLARPYTPTDKPHVERAFGTLNKYLFQKLDGYKGRSVSTRGAKSEVEDKACYFVWEIQELVDGIIDIYHDTHHNGLRNPGNPRDMLTPNEMFDIGVAACGFMTVPVDRSVALSLLAAGSRVVSRQGILVDYLYYDSIDLVPYRAQKSPFPDGRYPIRYDRNDMSRIWVWLCTPSDATDGDWTEVPCTVRNGQRPFSDLEAQYAKSLTRVEDRRSKPYEQRQVNTVQLEAYLDRVDAGRPTSRREAQVAAKGKAKTDMAARDARTAGEHGTRPPAGGTVVNGHFPAPPADSDGDVFGDASTGQLLTFGIGDYQQEDADESAAEEGATAYLDPDTDDEFDIDPEYDPTDFTMETPS